MDKLPVEVLCMVFKRLPQKQLITLTTVSKLFNEIIEENNLIKGVKVTSDSPLESPKRKFSRAIIRSSNAANCVNALQATADSITEVTFEHHSSTLSTIVTALNLCPNVTRVTFVYVSLEDEDEAAPASVVQPLNDIELTFRETSPAIFKVLHQVSPKSLLIRFYGDTPYYDFTDMLPFMRVQKNLKSFSMGGIFESNLMYGHLPNGEYRLTEFSICNSDLEDWSYLETFLSEHTNTLEKLSIKEVPGWDPSSTINCCRRLKSLELEGVELGEITDEITTVEELAFTPPNAQMNKFPNVKKLFIGEATEESNRLLSASMRKVTDLTIRFGTVSGIQCERVTKMTLMNTQVIENNFFALHPKIESLALINYFQLDDAFLEVIVSNLKNLRVFKIHTLCTLTARAFPIMRQYCENLRVLDTKTWSQQFSADDWKCLHEINGIKIYTENFTLT